MIISMDIETENLKVNTQINFVGFYTINSKGKEVYKSFKLPEELEDLKSFIIYLKNKKYKFVLHNGKFDSVRLLYSYGIDIYIDHDTMILGYLMSTVDELKYNQGKWLGLKYMAPRILGVDNWDVDLKTKTSKSRKDVDDYLKLDCKYCYELYQYFKRNFPKEKLNTYKLIIKAINCYRNIELNGLPIDFNSLNEVRESYLKEKIIVDQQLKEYKDINYNSSKQLQELLFFELQLPIVAITDKGVPSTGVAALKELEGTHPIIPLILKHREIEKAIAFLDSWKDEAILHPDGYYYLHSNFNLHGTVTGRTSSSEVNLQQIPRNKKLKSLFKSTIPGWEMVCMDYSQLELRFAGIVANVKAIKDSYRNGEDLHYKMASTVTGKPVSQVTKEERTQAKAANFGFIYGMQAKSFVEYAKVGYGVNITQEESSTIRYHFFEMYPELLEYYDNVRTTLLNEASLTSIMQREYKLNPQYLYNPYERENILRAAINFPVQSAGSDYVISGLIEVMTNKELKDSVRIGATVHDSIIGLVKKDEKFYDNLAKIKNIMEHPKLAQQMLTVNIDIPIVVDVEIGPLGKGVSIEEYKEIHKNG